MASTRFIRTLCLCSLLAAPLGCNGSISGDHVSGDPSGPQGPGGTVPETYEPDPEVLACNDGRVTPGRVSTRRLNRTELNTIVEELFFDTSRPADSLPADGAIGGYDTVGEGLTVAPAHARAWWAVAEDLVGTLMASAAVGGSIRQDAEEASGRYCPELSAPGFANLCNDVFSIYHDFDVPAAGLWDVQVRAFGERAGDELPMMEVQVDGRVVSTVEVEAEAADPQIYTVAVDLTAGSHRVEVWFRNDLYDDTVVPPINRDLQVDWIQVSSPESGGMRSDIISCSAEEIGEVPCLTEIATRFGSRAWRRPLQLDEVTSLVSFGEAAMAEGDSFDSALSQMLTAMLLSPHFLYRVEGVGVPGEELSMVTDWELASRLSLAIYSGLPDENIITHAEAGDLHQPEVLETQARRMLADARGRSFSENFVRQWLEISDLTTVDRDRDLYPEFASLARSMQMEATAFFDSFRLQSKPVTELVTADYAFVNESLAGLYGLEGVSGTDLQRVELEGSRIGGAMGLAATLAGTAKAAKTSVILRGKFVLERLLCVHIAPPPPTAESDNALLVDPTASSREQSNQRRGNAVCEGCHSEMDPVGLAFENYDAMGAYRTEEDNGFSIDPSGETPSVGAFSGPEDLLGSIAEDPRFEQCFAEQLHTYLVGRRATRDDQCALEQVATGSSLEDYVVGIITSDAFRLRAAEEGGR